MGQVVSIRTISASFHSMSCSHLGMQHSARALRAAWRVAGVMEGPRRVVSNRFSWSGWRILYWYSGRVSEARGGGGEDVPPA